MSPVVLLQVVLLAKRPAAQVAAEPRFSLFVRQHVLAQHVALAERLRAPDALVYLAVVVATKVLLEVGALAEAVVTEAAHVELLAV